MLLVIFGAGASFDSVHHLPPPRPHEARKFHEEFRPPLANQLFEDRPDFVAAMQRFPDCMDLVPILRRRGAAIEKELARLQAEAPQYPRRDQQLAAIRYYLHFMLWECQQKWRDDWHKGITNYRTLLDEIERLRRQTNEPVLFVTFNYDTMLENAMLETVGFNVEDIDTYVQRSDYILIKLHGSVNWGREIDGIEGVSGPLDSRKLGYQGLINAGNKLRVSDRFTLVSHRPMVINERAALVFPALAIPVENKDEFSCPDRHVHMLETLLREVTHIATIGWRATEVDFLAMLKEKLINYPKIMIVSGDDKGATETFDNITKYATQIDKSSVRVTGGFTGLIEDLGFLRILLGK